MASMTTTQTLGCLSSAMASSYSTDCTTEVGTCSCSYCRCGCQFHDEAVAI